MQIASIGTDLGNSTFHPVALGERNKVLVRKKLFQSYFCAPQQQRFRPSLCYVFRKNSESHSIRCTIADVFAGGRVVSGQSGQVSPSEPGVRRC